MIDRSTRRLIENLKRRVMFFTALSLVLAIALCVMTVLYITKDSSKGNESNASVNSSAGEVADNDVSGTSQQNSSKDENPSVAVQSLGDRSLRLVNSNNPLPSGFTIETSKIEASYARDVGMEYDARAVSYLNAMCAAAEKDGVNLLVISCFRTNARQTILYNNQVSKQRAKYPEKSDAEIKKLAATISAYPGTSEHELGLAIDFNSVDQSFENTKHFMWLKTHAADYGFVLRYPKEKQDITGVIYEPWHYRYVGERHAKKMNELGYCLEEYVSYLGKNTK